MEKVYGIPNTTLHTFIPVLSQATHNLLSSHLTPRFPGPHDRQSPVSKLHVPPLHCDGHTSEQFLP